MPDRSAVVFGAGKISRGFVGHLLGLGGFATTFVDVNVELVAALSERGRYHVHVLGAPEKDAVVEHVSALSAADARVVDAVTACDIAFVSVGGANLPAVAEVLAPAAAERATTSAQPLDVIVCENWRSAAATLREAVGEQLAPEVAMLLEGKLGIAEATILRSCIDATPEQRKLDPLAVQAQDFWSLPLDADALVVPLPPVPGLEPVHNFASALERKLYTYNMGNATISYVGWLRGHRLLSDAANDDVIREVVERAYDEMGRALCRRFGFELDEQRVFAARSLRKFQDRAIVDPLARQVRDPLRKLARHDRLVGAAMVAIEEGILPQSVALGIAAALRHRNPADPSAERLGELVRQLGEPRALAAIGGVPHDGPLVALAMEQMPVLERLMSLP